MSISVVVKTALKQERLDVSYTGNMGIKGLRKVQVEREKVCEKHDNDLEEKVKVYIDLVPVRSKGVCVCFWNI